MTKKTTYTVRVRNPNSWSPVDGSREIVRECGHKHTSITTALRCERKLKDERMCCGSWSCNADWHNSRVEATDNSIDSETMDALTREAAIRA